MTRATTHIVLASAVCAALFSCLSSAPALAAPSPPALADELEANDVVLRAAIDDWRAAAGDPPAGQAPGPVMEPANLLEERVRFLARRGGLAKRTIALLPGRLRWQVKTMTRSQRKLFKLAPPGPPRKLRTGKPEPLANLVSHYAKAERHHRVARHFLAAVNFVETKFGRVKSKSSAGARGPMQFIPSTWRIYGRGSIHDPHDAIQAAARLLRDGGAPRRYGRALYAYNPSRLYVAAVTGYAKVIARDPYAIHFLYCWGP